MGSDIVCDNVVIVPTGTSMAQAVAKMSAYFCSQIAAIPNYVGGDNINIMLNDDGDFVIDTINPMLRKIVLNGQFPNADSLTINIPRTTIEVCDIPSLGCNANSVSFTDFVIQGFFYSTDGSTWINFTELDKTTIKVNTAGDLTIGASLVPSPSEYPVNWRIIIIG
jgi:hypothetical protein